MLRLRDWAAISIVGCVAGVIVLCTASACVAIEALDKLCVLPAAFTTELRTDEAEMHRCSVSGTPQAPHSYAPPLVSNGSVSLLVDYEGGQTQREFARMTPAIWWAGRRYGASAGAGLIPFGHFKRELTVDGKKCGAPTAWTQTLDTRSAVVTCQNEYDNGVVAETTVFTPLQHDLIVVKQRVTSKTPGTRNARVAFRYQFTPVGEANRLPKSMTSSCEWDEASKVASFRYRADASRIYDGVISIFSDQSATAAIDRQELVLSSDVMVAPDRPAEVSTYLLFADSLDGDDFQKRAANLQTLIRQQGYDGLLAAHRKGWEDYWKESYVHLPNDKLERVYNTAQYQMRSSATRWSYAIAILDSHWSARYFGWDEMFCHQALVSSNHLEIARRCPQFRFAGLKVALQRASHYWNPGKYGARYPWETLEDGTEGAVSGFWMDHVFHISNIAESAWHQYLYTNDEKYLREIGYPVVKECARFFLAYMVYELPDGTMFLGKCTDLERLGPARQNPFMTSCGAIYTMESAAQAAGLLKTDEAEAATWRHAAAKLRESLPNKDGRYVPYAGCQEESIATVGGLFPYPLFDATSALQKNAACWFLQNGRKSGNMYPTGHSMCAWYAGWLAAAMARLEDRQEPANLLTKAAAGAGCFAELFEINEPKVIMRPWLGTASGSYVFAVNQALVQSRDDRILIAPAVPGDWKDYSFKLACFGNLVAEVAVHGGRLVKLTLIPGNPEAEHQRTLVLPEGLVAPATLNKNVVSDVTTQNGQMSFTTRFRGQTEITNEAGTP